MDGTKDMECECGRKIGHRMKGKCPGLLTLDELAAIAAARKMTAEEIGTAVMSWRKETRVNRK